MRIYVASSWRNEQQQDVVAALRDAGHEVYDFKHPAEGDHGFHWSEIDPDWKSWSPAELRVSLHHPLALAGFGKDEAAMEWAEACVYVLPCGRSASLEAGWMIGSGRPTAILLADGEPELMYRLAFQSGGAVCTSLDEVVEWAASK